MNSGVCWHRRHTVLIEWCPDYDQRAEDIRNNKPESQQAIRLSLFKLVKGELPEGVVKALQAYEQAWRTHEQTMRARDQTWQAYIQAWQTWQPHGQISQARDQAVQADNQASQAHNQAVQACVQASQARDQVLKNEKEAIERLHSLECPNCPWNGQTIFPDQC